MTYYDSRLKFLRDLNHYLTDDVHEFEALHNITRLPSKPQLLFWQFWEATSLERCEKTCLTTDLVGTVLPAIPLLFGKE